MRVRSCPLGQAYIEPLTNWETKLWVISEGAELCSFSDLAFQDSSNLRSIKYDLLAENHRNL